MLKSILSIVGSTTLSTLGLSAPINQTGASIISGALAHFNTAITQLEEGITLTANEVSDAKATLAIKEAEFVAIKLGINETIQSADI